MWQRYRCNLCDQVFAVKDDIGGLHGVPSCPACDRRGYSIPVVETPDGCEIDERLCECKIGAGECAIHPGRTKTQEEKVAFRKAWDARVVPSNPEQMRGRPGS